MKAFNKAKMNPRKVNKFKINKEMKNKYINFDLKNGVYRIYVVGEKYKISHCKFKNIYNKVAITLSRCKNIYIEDCCFIGKKLRYKKIRRM